MIEVKEIVRFCETRPSFKLVVGLREDLLIKKVNTIESAGPESMSWVSDGFLKSKPELIGNSRAGLVITPILNTPVPHTNSIIVQSSSPKRLFSECVHNFFNELTEGSLPKDAQLDSKNAIGIGVVIGKNVQLGKGCWIGPNTVIDNAVIGSNVKIGANCSIGLPGFGYERDENGDYFRFPHIGRVVIEDNVEIGSNTCVDRGALGNTLLKRSCKIDNLVHIAHNVVVGENVLIIANSMIGGSSIIERDSWISPSVSVINGITVGGRSLIGMGAVVLKNVEENKIYVGNPAKVIRSRE